MLTATAGESLLNQLAQEVSQLCPEVNLLQIRSRIAAVLAMYEVRFAQLPGANPDIQEKARLFLSAKKLEGLSPISLESYRLELQVFSEHVNKKAVDVTTNDIRMFLSEFPHLKNSSISKKLSVLKSFFGWLTNEEIIERDPSRKIRPPKKEARMPRALTIEELEMLRESCVTRRERAMLEVLYATGGRLSEIQKLDKKDINYQAMSARVIGKGDKEREVYFSFKSIYHLKKYLMGRLDDCPALFITERRPFRRLSRRGIQREIAAIAARASIQKDCSPHTLRHTFATLTLNNGADITVIQALLGHSSPATTQVYAQISEGRKLEQYKKHFVQ